MLLEAGMHTSCKLVLDPLQMINIGTSKIYPWGWRLSLGLCMVPATTLLLGGIFLDDTPNSLCERGYPEKVRRTQLLHLLSEAKDVRQHCVSHSGHSGFTKPVSVLPWTETSGGCTTADRTFHAFWRT